MKKDLKTTVTAGINLLALMGLAVLWYIEDITTEEFTVIAACVTSVLTSVIGYLTADSKNGESE